jgi:hypothetical protein
MGRRAAVGETVFGGEEEGALALPVFCCDEAGDDAGGAGWGAVLPVGEWFIAEHPGPLAVVRVADCQIGVHWVGDVVGVEAAKVRGVGVAVALAVAGDYGCIDPVCVVGKGCL